MILGILDQSIVHHDQTSGEALNETIATAKLAEKLGYTRFWVSEHHNSLRVAGTSPEILMANLAAQTNHIRIGSGGIMLPNHSEFKVAENFRMLETLYPGRIDLGMGRAPGGDRISATLLNPSNRFREGDYLKQLEYLQGFFNDKIGTHRGKITAMPRSPTPPEQWILSSSGGSSSIAAKFGMGLAVAKFINGFAHPSVVETYKKEFQPSEQFHKPYVMVSIIVLCAETRDVAAEMRKYVDYTIVQMARGDMNSSNDYDFIMNYDFSPEEQEVIKQNSGRVVSGTKDEVKKQLDGLTDMFEADELMITNMSGHSVYRRKSFELLAEIYQVSSSRQADISKFAPDPET